MTDEKESKLESVKLIKYTGQADRWREWSKKVIAYAKTKNFHLALTNFSDENVTDKMKSDALNFLTMSLSGDAFSFVENAENSGEVWSELEEEYAPTDDHQIFDLQEEFLKCHLSSDDENPVMWFKRLEYLNSRLRAIDSKFAKNENDYKVHVKFNLPTGIYSELLVAVRKDFKTMLWKEFKSEIRQHWRQWKRNEEKENKENIMVTNLDRGNKKFGKGWKKKQFKGRCRNCGTYGHKAADCPERKDRNINEKKLKNVKCWKCGGYGHYANKCPNGKKNERNLFVGNVFCNGNESDEEDMIETYDSDEEDDEEIILIGNDSEDDMIKDDESADDVEIVMNVDQEEDNLSMMDIVDDEGKATVNDDATNDIEQLDLVESNETRMSKRMKNDDTEWIKVSNGVLVTNYEEDKRDLREINEKWKNQYEVLEDVEQMTNVIRKLDLSSSDEESVEKLFKEDSSEDEEVTNENTKKKIKIDENVEEKNVENVPPTNEQNYMIHDMMYPDSAIDY